LEKGRDECAFDKLGRSGGMAFVRASGLTVVPPFAAASLLGRENLVADGAAQDGAEGLPLVGVAKGCVSVPIQDRLDAAEGGAAMIGSREQVSGYSWPSYTWKPAYRLLLRASGASSG
jgi:hypothetical protein